MPVEPLNLSLARSDAAQQVQNLFAQADRAGRAAAGEKGQAVAAHDAMAVTGPDPASEASRIREEETGGSGSWEGTPHAPEPEANPEEVPSADLAGLGHRIDITA
ncbi:MAG: hypothetical protein K8T20_17740 [Planctomycetes bacterium]|nr:hypothetical protein [Planctomycetota bacterium]